MSARRTPLLSSLVVGAAFAGVALGSAGCGDENDPATWVKRLDDPAQRVQAVNRLVLFYEDRTTQDKHDKGVACTSDNESAVCQSRSCGEDKTCKLQVKPLLDTIVEPLTQRCVAGDLDDRTNTKLIKFLSDSHDPKAVPCFIKTLKDYKVDSNEEDVRAVCRAVASMKLKEASGPLFEVFTKVKASKKKAQETGLPREVHDAMIALDDPSWESQLIGYLGHAVDQKDQNAFTDEMFYQITAAEILGRVKSAGAVKPLLKMMLNPAKGAGQLDAVLALVKIGKPSIGPAVALLKGEDKELVDYGVAEATKAAGSDAAAKKAADKAYVAPAALVLATIGREETAAPLIDAIGKADDVSKAIMARELTKLPRNPNNVKAFEEVVDKLPIALSIPNSRGGAREVLLDKVADFYDPSVIPWTLDSLKKMKGEENDLAPIREAAFGGMLKIMKQDQISTVDQVASMKSGDGTVGKGFDKEFKLAKELLTQCGDKVDCYLAKLTDPNMMTDEKQFAGIKAAYMVGVLGDASAAKKIADNIPKISHPAIRFAAVTALDSLLPKGDAGVAAALQKIVDEAIEQKNQEKMKLNGPLKTVIYRLNARAQ